MNKQVKIMVGGAIVLGIGIIVLLIGFNNYTSIEDPSMLGNGVPPGTGVTIVGILIAVVGAFISIYGFGLLPEEPKGQSAK